MFNLVERKEIGRL